MRRIQSPGDNYTIPKERPQDAGVDHGDIRELCLSRGARFHENIDCDPLVVRTERSSVHIF